MKNGDSPVSGKLPKARKTCVPPRPAKSLVEK